MKIRISEVFNEVDEKFVQLINDDQTKDDMDDAKIKELVYDKIGKHTKTKLPKVYIACAVLALITVFVGFTYLYKLNKNEIITNKNKELIGSEIVENAPQVYEAGEAIEEPDLSNEKLLRNSSIINEIRDESLFPSSIVEIEVEKAGDMSYRVPEQIMINNSLSLLVKRDKAGWELKKGEKLECSFEKYESNVVDNQTLIIGYVLDGILYEGTAFTQMAGTYSLDITEDGTYYIYMLCASSDYLSIKEADIYVSDHAQPKS